MTNKTIIAGLMCLLWHSAGSASPAIDPLVILDPVGGQYYEVSTDAVASDENGNTILMQGQLVQMVDENLNEIGPKLEATGDTRVQQVGLLSAVKEQMESAAVRLPTVRVPAVRLPSIKPNAVRVPAVRVPTVRVPETSETGVRMPSIHPNAVRVPTVRYPEAAETAVRVPSIKPNAVRVPAIRVPETAEPGVRMPSIKPN